MCKDGSEAECTRCHYHGSAHVYDVMYIMCSVFAAVHVGAHHVVDMPSVFDTVVAAIAGRHSKSQKSDLLLGTSVTCKVPPDRFLLMQKWLGRYI